MTEMSWDINIIRIVLRSKERGYMMNLKTFLRGVHPYDGKALSKDEAIRRVLPEGEMVYPLSQHIGAPAVPTVAPGDRVLVGQQIAAPGGFVSAGICSSVSGTVKKIDVRTTIVGETRECIIIENDGQYEPVPGLGDKRDYTGLSPKEIRDIIRDAGIVGIGGAGFPTHVKLTTKDDSKVEYIIVNGAECEPYLTSDYRLMLERPDELLTGLKVILSLFPNAKGVIGIEDNKPDAIKLLQEKTAGESKIEVCPLKTKYPQGGERMLIHAITDRDINSTMLPFDAGCIVQNVATVIAIYQAVCCSTPLITKVMTITGDAVKSPCNLEVSLGCSHQSVLDAAGGFAEQPEKIISGGPMMGTAMFTLDIPVQKTSSSILAFVEDEVADYPATNCIHCGRCVHACPANLVPQMLDDAVNHDDFARFEKLGGMECMECGACTISCPARRPLTQGCKYGKQMVNRQRREAKAKAEAAAKASK